MKQFKSFMALALAICLAGCGSSSTASTSTAESESVAPAASNSTEEKIPLKISHHPYIHALPTVYAEQNGLYDMFDYTVDYYSGGPVQNEAIASDAWEVGTTGIAGAVLGITGYNMKVIGIACDESTVTDMWCRNDSPLASAAVGPNGIIGTADDWRGLTILMANGTNTHMMLIAELNALGLTESDVNIIDCSSVPNVYTAFISGQGDVACLWSPYGYSLTDDGGYTKLGTIADLGIELPSLVVCTEKANNERPEVVEKWLGQYFKAADALRADETMAAEMLYNFEQDQGIVMEEKNAALEIKNREFWSVEKNKEYFETDSDGKSKIYNIIMSYAQFMLSQDKITQEQYDNMSKGDFVGSYILDLE